MRPTIAAIAALLTLAGTACDAQRPNPMLFQHQRLRSVAYSEAFAAAERAVGRHFRIKQRNFTAGIISGVPSEMVLNDAGTRIISGALGGSRQARRVVEVRVRPEGAYVDVHCRVLVQELETSRFRIMERERGAYDQPWDTPADLEASTTPEQNAVWVNRSRDRTMEREILSEVYEETGQKANNTKRPAHAPK